MRKTTLEAKLRSGQTSPEEFQMKLAELSKAKEELAQKKEDIRKLQNELAKLKEHTSKAQAKIFDLQRELNDKESCLKEHSQASKQRVNEQDRLVLTLKEENESLLDKLKSLEKQCIEQRKELDSVNIETKELRSTLIAALENANKTENLRKIEMEHAQHSMTAFEKQIDKGMNNKDLPITLLIFKSALVAALENNQAYKAICCCVSESFQQLINKDLLSVDKLPTLSSYEQREFAKHLFTTVLTEIKLLSLKVIDAENKIIKLNTQNLESDNKSLSQTAQLKDFKPKMQSVSKNPSISLASSFILDKENLALEMKYKRKGLNSEETSLGDLTSEGHSEHTVTEGSTLLKTPPERSPCQSIFENNSKKNCAFV